MKIKSKISAAVVAIVLAVSMLPLNAWAASNDSKAASMKMDDYSGTVTLENSRGTKKALRKGTGLYNGDVIKTGKNSYAYLLLDKTKAVKVNEDSEIKVQKNGTKLELSVVDGELYFDVSKPLEKKETLNIRTSSMVCGVRGTIGVVSSDIETGESYIYLLEGKTQITGRNIKYSDKVYVEAGEKVAIQGFVQDESNKDNGGYGDYIEKRALFESDIEPWVIERFDYGSENNKKKTNEKKKTADRIKKVIDVEYILGMDAGNTVVVDKAMTMSEILDANKASTSSLKRLASTKTSFSGNIKIGSKGSLTVDVPVSISGRITVEKDGVLNINESTTARVITSDGAVSNNAKARLTVRSLNLSSGSFSVAGQIIADVINVGKINISGGLGSDEEYIVTTTDLAGSKFADAGVGSFVCSDEAGKKYYGADSTLITMPILDEIKKGDKNVTLNPKSNIRITSGTDKPCVIELDDVKITGKALGVVNGENTYLRTNTNELAGTNTFLKAGKYNYKIDRDLTRVNFSEILINDAVRYSKNLEMPKSKVGLVAVVNKDLAISGVNLSLYNNGISIENGAALSVIESSISGSGCETLGYMISIGEGGASLELSSADISCDATGRTGINGTVSSPDAIDTKIDKKTVTEKVEVTFFYADPLAQGVSPLPYQHRESVGAKRLDTGEIIPWFIDGGFANKLGVVWTDYDATGSPMTGYFMKNDIVDTVVTVECGYVEMKGSTVSYTGSNADKYDIEAIVAGTDAPKAVKSGNTISIKL